MVEPVARSVATNNAGLETRHNFNLCELASLANDFKFQWPLSHS